MHPNKQHPTPCACEICKLGLEAIYAKEREWMQNPGWYAHYVMDDPDTPWGANIHTHGLPHTFGHSDLQIVVRTSQTQAHGLLFSAIELIKAGTRFEVGVRYQDIAEGYDAQFAWAHECGRDVLRMIIPDKNNRFDTQPLCRQWEVD